MDSQLQADILKGSVGVIALFIVLTGLWLVGKIRSEREVTDRDLIVASKDKEIEKRDQRITELMGLLNDTQQTMRTQQEQFRTALDLLESQLLGPSDRRRSRASRPV